VRIHARPVSGSRHTRFTDFIGKGRWKTPNTESLLAIVPMRILRCPTVARGCTPRDVTRIATNVAGSLFPLVWTDAPSRLRNALEEHSRRPMHRRQQEQRFGIMALFVGPRGVSSPARTARSLPATNRQLSAKERRATTVHGRTLDGRSRKKLACSAFLMMVAIWSSLRFWVQGLLAVVSIQRSQPRRTRFIVPEHKLWDGIEWDWYRRGPDSERPLLALVVELGRSENLRLPRLQRDAGLLSLAIASRHTMFPLNFFYCVGWAITNGIAIAEVGAAPRRMDPYPKAKQYFGN